GSATGRAGAGRVAPGRARAGRAAPARAAGTGRAAPGRAGTGRAAPDRAVPGRRRRSAPLRTEGVLAEGAFTEGAFTEGAFTEDAFTEDAFTETAFMKGADLPSAPKSGSRQRVQKVLARAGLASRRQAEALIAEGRVRVDGKRLNKQGTLVDPRHDSISVDGRRVAPERLTYLLFHKPREVMCTMRDPLGRRSVVDYLRGVESRVVPVGRLDYQTSGVLLLTNDG